LDKLASYNKERWEALAQAGIEFSRPALDLDGPSAREMVDPHGLMGNVAGADVLCLASGGGQQSAAFGLLGARITVFDLSDTQLERDRQAAAHYGLQVRTVQGDMRDLSAFASDTFDVVWHAHSINFVPDARQVFAEVARVLRPEGLYRVHLTNPFVMGLDERDWDGNGYPLNRPYADGEVRFEDPHWDVWQVDGSVTRVVGPREFRHTLSTLINGLVEHGFVILGAWEDTSADPGADPGTWEHFRRIAPPWITFWARYRPDAFA